MDYGFLYIYAASELGYNHSLCDFGLLMSLHPLKKIQRLELVIQKLRYPKPLLTSDTLRSACTSFKKTKIQEVDSQTDHDATLKDP